MEFVMKKVILVLMIFLLLGSSSVWGIDREKTRFGLLGIGGGVLVFFAPNIFGMDGLEATMIKVSGAAIGGIGLIWLIQGVLGGDDSGSYSFSGGNGNYIEDFAIKKHVNPIREHLILDTVPGQINIGAKFSF
jgi:hypothetical protein